MDRFEWNGLRPGALVVIHAHPTLDLVEGHVSSVGRAPRRNDVGVRLADRSTRWPVPAEVHALPRRDDATRCWRCSLRHQNPTP